MVVDRLVPTMYRKGAGSTADDVIHVGERGNEFLTPCPRGVARV
jgi:hypothetical protein